MHSSLLFFNLKFLFSKEIFEIFVLLVAAVFSFKSEKVGQ